MRILYYWTAIHIVFLSIGVSSCSKHQPEPSSSYTLSCIPDIQIRSLPTRGNSIFAISMNYPTELMVYNETNYPWLRYNPTNLQQWRTYLWTVLKYAYTGNIESDWRSGPSEKRWYHAPWMHKKYKWDTATSTLSDTSGFGGREWVHGLTQERSGAIYELDTARRGDSTKTRTWAVSVYNLAGGYTIGRAWKNICEKKFEEPVAFTPGTVAIKLLFTDASSARVPYLNGSIEWKANIEKDNPDSCIPLRLLQIDIAVRDPRVDATTGWVFGTFVVRTDLPIDSYWGDTTSIPQQQLPWYKVRPLGLAWGNDTTSAQLNHPAVLNQFIDKDLQRRIRDNLGWKGRLNGPVDNPKASCISCHELAQRSHNMAIMFESASTPFTRAGSEDTLREFFLRNIRPGEAFTPGMDGLDYSLQLQAGMANYLSYLKYQEAEGHHTKGP